MAAVLIWAGGASAQVTRFPAPQPGASGGGTGAETELSVYSSLDNDLAAPLIAAFQARHPGIAIGYFEAARATDPQAANRALAELYARTGDAALAVAAWQALPPDTLTASDRLSAARSALAAGDPADSGPRRSEVSVHTKGGRPCLHQHASHRR